MSLYRDLIKKFEYPHHPSPPSKGEGDGGGNDLK